MFYGNLNNLNQYTSEVEDTYYNASMRNLLICYSFSYSE